MKKTSLIILIILFILPFSLFAQYGEDTKYRFGESYEMSGDYENASRIYKELFDQNPRRQYFDALLRTYISLNKYKEIYEIGVKFFEKNKYPEIYIGLGELAWRLGNFAEAEIYWNDAIANYKTNDSLYLKLAGLYSQLRLVEKAINTLKIGRTNLNSINLFTDELIRLYIASGNYLDGTDEVLKLFNRDKDLSYSQGRLYALMTNKKGEEYIVNKLKEEAEKNNNNIYYQQLYSFFLRTVGDLKEALRLTIRIDDLKNSQGREILYFADRSRRDGEYDIAMEAYEVLMDRGESFKYFSSALFGFAQSLESKMKSENKFDEQTVNDVISRYRSIISKYPNESKAAESKYGIALLSFYQLNDTESAIKELEEIIKKFPNLTVTASAYNLLGEIYVFKNNLEKAAEYFVNVEQKFNRQHTSGEYSKAIYRLAQILFYRGMTDSASVIYQKVAADPNSDAANDALDKVVLIEKNKQFTLALKQFSEAELLEEQKKTEEAKNKYEEVIATATGEDIAQYAAIKIAEIVFKEKKFDETRDVLNDLLKSSPETIYADIAYMIIGDTFREQGNKEDAIQNYSIILSNYPRSIYLKDARIKIRKLRNENT